RNPTAKSNTAAPTVSFVSLGCPKALVDSERIVTRLRAEGYELSQQHQGSEVFLTAPRRNRSRLSETLSRRMAKSLSLGAWGEDRESLSTPHPDVQAISGPQQYEAVVEACHKALPPKHDPFLSLVPPEGIKLTPRHYAYLKISEGCNN